MRASILCLVASLSAAVEAAPFSFVALGDTAYMLPRDTPRMDGLIDAINRERPAFAVHVGDFKGYSSCSDVAYAAHRSQLNRIAAPLFLTPGDNDWSDCGAQSAGGYAPLDRLASLRTMFFADDRSLGGTPVTVIRQAGFPENAFWARDGLALATVHVTGPANGFVRDKAMAADGIDRSRAGEQWVRQAFDRARKGGAKALVIAFQADVWANAAPTYEDGPYDWLRTAIGEEAASFGGQVLVVHGDSHRFIVDTPFRRADVDAGSTRGMNVTRLMVPGWPDHRAVRVDVDLERPEVFGFRLVVPLDERLGAKP